MGVEHGYGTSFDKHGLISFQGQWNNGVPLVPKKELVEGLNELLSQRGVTTVTHRPICRMFTIAKCDRARFLDYHFLWRKRRSFVRTVAEWLIF